jgi:hypothetical protein
LSILEICDRFNLVNFKNHHGEVARMAKVVLKKAKRGRKKKKGKKKTQAQKAAERLKKKKYHRLYYLAHRGNKSENKNPGPARNKDGTERKRRAPGASKNASIKFERDQAKVIYQKHQIMRLPTEKTLKVLEKIIAGEKMLID